MIVLPFQFIINEVGIAASRHPPHTWDLEGLGREQPFV